MTNSNVIQLEDPERSRRRARGEFIKNLIDREDRSVRYVAIKAGISPTSMGDRVKGKAPFLLDELEMIAAVLRLDPVELYKDYIAVGSDGFEPSTSSVKSRDFDAVVLPFRRVLTAAN